MNKSMKATNYLIFNLTAAIRDCNFSFVRLIINEKEIPIRELEKHEREKSKSWDGHSLWHIGNNEIMKLKNKNVNLELIYSFEFGNVNRITQFYFFHDLNKNSLIIKEISPLNFEPIILKYRNFFLKMHSSNHKFYTLNQ
jgi:mannosyltransferase OCH1-like enzyme